MSKKFIAAAGLASLAMVWVLSAQSPLQTVINNSMKAMGVPDVKTLTIMGEGGDGAVGQQLDSQADKWRWYSDKNVVRGYDFDAKGYHTQRVRGEGNVPPGGGNGTTTPAPTAPQDTVTMATNFNAQVEMAMTPIGFLKFAAEKNAAVSQKTEKGKKWTVLSIPMEGGGGANAPTYKTSLNGYIDDKGMVQKVEVMVSEAFLGDIPWRADFTDWKDFSGVKFPATIVQRQGDPKISEMMISDIKINQPVDLAPPAAKGKAGAPGGGGAPGGAKGGAAPGGAAAAKGGPGGPGAAKGAAAPAASLSEDLGGGFWMVGGGYASVIVDFKDYIMLIETPSNDARMEQIIAEAHRLIPNKPIKYAICTHYHFDHSTGVRAAVAEGATIIVHKDNKGLFEKAIANPHMLVPDKLAKMTKKPKAKIEYVGEKKVYTDGVHTVETYHIQGSSHNTSSLMIYLPKQKILIEADEFNVLNPTPTAPVPNPNSYQVNLVNEVKRLKLDVDRIIPIHLPNDNHKVTWQELKYSGGVQ